MARYILLQVEDNAEASALVKQIMKYKMVEVATEVTEKDIETGVSPFGSSAGEEVVKEVPVFVRAVWNVYDYCTCETKKAWSQGKTSGLWVCTICKKPSKACVEGDAWHAQFGRNLLPISAERPEWRGPSHKKHPGYDPGASHQGPLARRTDGHWRD